MHIVTTNDLTADLPKIKVPCHLLMGRSGNLGYEDAAKKIKAHIDDNNPGVKDLTVEFDDGIVDLCGECESPEAYEKTVLMAGNVKGVVDVYTSGMTIAQAPDAPAIVMETPAELSEPSKQSVPVVTDAPKVEYYVIKSGDTLGKIAKNYYGNASQYPRIFEANKEVIEDPDKIYPGQKIRIPLD